MHLVNAVLLICWYENMQLSSTSIAAAHQSPPLYFTPTEAMAFSGPAPEIINGRLAMLGLLLALGGEVSSNESFLGQLSAHSTAAATVMVLLAGASLVPMLRGADLSEAFGPFNQTAEMLNGRAAMIGITALILLELVNGAALF